MSEEKSADNIGDQSNKPEATTESTPIDDGEISSANQTNKQTQPEIDDHSKQTQSSAQKPEVVSLFVNEDDPFNLFVFSHKKGSRELPDPSDITGWIERNGVQMGDPIPFKKTHAFKFFKTLFELTNLDFLRMVGGSVAAGDLEGFWCCGLLLNNHVILGCERLTELINDKGKRGEAGNRAVENGIDGIWFMRTVQEFHYLLEECKKADSVAIGYFE